MISFVPNPATNAGEFPVTRLELLVYKCFELLVTNSVLGISSLDDTSQLCFNESLIMRPIITIEIQFDALYMHFTSDRNIIRKLSNQFPEKDRQS